MSQPKLELGSRSQRGFPLHHLRRILVALIVGSLATAALVYTTSLLMLGMSREDLGRLETPFALLVAMEVEQGPEVLYGPYERENHLVLIHAPLYYRLAALGASFLHRFGVEPVNASIVAGRLLSLVATILVLSAAASLSRRDGGSPQAALFAILLIAAAPIPGILSVMVRPNALAVAFQTWGVLWVLVALVSETGTSVTRKLLMAYVVFALSFCTKQHHMIAPAISSALLAVAGFQRRMRVQPIMLAHLAGLGVVLIDMIGEQVVTGGRMLQSAFVLPGGPFRTILLGSWTHVAATFAIVGKKLIGYIVLAACCGMIVRPLGGSRLDRLLLIYTAAEVAAQFPLYYFNAGAADNYVFQAVVFASVMMGRCLARLLDKLDGRIWGLTLAALTSSIIAARDFQFVELVWRTRTEDRYALRELLSRPPGSRRKKDGIYFVDRPDLNRLHGNRRLAHDEFAYNAFEAVGVAEPRSVWLKSALETGEVQLVVIPDDRTTVSGLQESLPDLGYHPAGRFGVYRVWERVP